MGWESVSAILPLAEYQNRKIFVSLIEKNLGGVRLKNVEKIFLFCSPKRSGGGRKRWAGQSAKSRGFCWKKVLTSSSKHHLWKTKSHFVYFLQSLKDSSYYIGVTNNVSNRFRDHNSGLSRSTAPNKPWVLKRVEEYSTINEAYKRERFLKKMKSRKIIEKIIDSDE